MSTRQCTFKTVIVIEWQSSWKFHCHRTVFSQTTFQRTQVDLVINVYYLNKHSIIQLGNIEWNYYVSFNNAEVLKVYYRQRKLKSALTKGINESKNIWHSLLNSQFAYLSALFNIINDPIYCPNSSFYLMMKT